MDLKVIADALAAQFTSVSATFAGRTETLTATASLPDSIDLALLVYPPTGSLSLNVGTQRDDEYDFPVRLLRDPLSMPGRSDALYAWFNALRDKAEANMDLGLSYVQWVRVIASRMEPDGQPYSFSDGSFRQFDVVELIHRVKVREFVTTAAI